MTPENVPYSSYRNGKLNTPEYLGLGCREFLKAFQQITDPRSTKREIKLKWNSFRPVSALLTYL